jgi:hypothetical protein
VRAQPFALLNHYEVGGPNGRQGALDYLFAQDSTAVESAAAQARIAQTASAEASASAASATATATTLAALTGAGGAAGTIALHTSQIAALVSENAAQATSITNLTSALSGTNNTVGSHSTQLLTLANENTARAASITALTASLNATNSTVAGHTASINALATENIAQATSLATLNASFTGINNTVAGHTASINALASENAGQATALATLNAQSGGQSASISALNAVAADSQAKLASARVRIVASASGARPARFELFSDNAPGGTQSFAQIAAEQIFFGDNTIYDDANDILHTTIAGGVVNAIAWGTPFGIAGDSLLEWIGQANIAVSARSKANAHFYKSAVPPFIGGNALMAQAATTSIPIGLGISAAAIRTVAPGGVIAAFAQLIFGPISSSTTARIILEAGVGGANFAAMPGNITSDSGDSGDQLLLESTGTYSNTSQVTQVVHIRANATRTGSATGPVDAGRSYLQV